jgi:beta-lactamase class A
MIGAAAPGPPARREALALLAGLLIGPGCASLREAGPAPPPAALEARLLALAAGFPGRVGIAAMDVDAGWVAAVDGASLYPQQSVSKLWVALAVFAAVDAGRLRLTDEVLVRREDMSVFNQPIQERLGPEGLWTTIDGLLNDAIARSDNAANDILVRRLGGPATVAQVLAARGVRGVRTGPEERVLQSKIAGLDWRSDYSFGRAFWDARDRLDPALRRARLKAYLEDPDDGAAPEALVRALARLQRGELLSPPTTRRFLEILAATTTGPARLKAGLPTGWSIAHKTGTGQDLADLSTGYNDVGLLTAPDGRRFAAAVMIASTRAPVPARQALMAEVARAVVAAAGAGVSGH